MAFERGDKKPLKYFILLHSPRKHRKDPKVQFLSPKVQFLLLTIWKFQLFFRNFVLVLRILSNTGKQPLPHAFVAHNAPVGSHSSLYRPARHPLLFIPFNDILHAFFDFLIQNKFINGRVSPLRVWSMPPPHTEHSSIRIKDVLCVIRSIAPYESEICSSASKA